MRITPTALGAKGSLFFGAVLLAYFATPYSNLFFLLTAFLGVLGLQGGLGALRNLAGIDCEWVAAPPSAAGSRQEVVLRLLAGKRRRFALDVRIVLDGGPRRMALLPTATGTALVRGQIEDLPRGVHRVRAVWIESRHPFGIARTVRRLPVTGELVVHPRPAELRRDASGTLSDLIGSSGSTAGDEMLAGLRPYRDGDSLRHVHWKASARRCAPVLKEYERPRGDGIELVLDRRTDDAALETMLSLATALLLRAAEIEQPLRLCSQDHDRRYGPGHDPASDGLRWLAAASALPADAPPPPVPGSGAVFLPARPGPGELVHG